MYTIKNGLEKLNFFQSLTLSYLLFVQGVRVLIREEAIRCRPNEELIKNSLLKRSAPHAGQI